MLEIPQVVWVGLRDDSLHSAGVGNYLLFTGGQREAGKRLAACPVKVHQYERGQDTVSRAVQLRAGGTVGIAASDALSCKKSMSYVYTQRTRM